MHFLLEEVTREKDGVASHETISPGPAHSSATASFCFNTSTSHDPISLSSPEPAAIRRLSESQLPASLGCKFYSQPTTLPP